MKNDLVGRVIILKEKVKNLKSAGVLQKPARAEAILEDAVFLLEELVKKAIIDG